TEMELINKYKTDDVDKIISEINKVKPEYNKKQHLEIEKIKVELAEAKEDYLNKVSKIGVKYDKAVSDNNRLDNLLVKFGKQSVAYTPDKYEIIGYIAEVRG